MHHYPMPKWFYGAYEAVDDAMALLETYRLARVRRLGAPPKRLQNSFFLTADGAEAADELASTPRLNWYAPGRTRPSGRRVGFREPAQGAAVRAGGVHEDPVGSRDQLDRRAGAPALGRGRAVERYVCRGLCLGPGRGASVSTLVQAVADRLDMPVANVEAVLAEHHVSAVAAPAAAARLHLSAMRFAAVKTLTGVNADGTQAAADHTEQVPVQFSWDFVTGLHGVGSDKNLRGKSSITRILLWALRGRCDLREDVRNWLRHVEVDFLVDTTEYRLAFDVANGVPNGRLVRKHGSSWATSGTFSDDAEFEGTMGATMMNALSLPAIAATQEGRRFQHAWPTYAGALVVRGDSLDVLLGDVKFAGLPSRLLQMFVGSDWAAARAEATSAHTVAAAQLTQVQKAAEDHAAAMGAAYQAAEQAVAEARARLDALPEPSEAMAGVEAALRRLPALDEAATAVNAVVADAKTARDQVAAELSAVKFARNATAEDALAHRFFQQLRPTVCPRCSAPVTAERRVEEEQGHTCSVCVTTLDLEAFEQDRLTATSATGVGPGGSAADPDHREDEEEIVDDVVALEKAVADAERRLAEAQAEQQRRAGDREQVAAIITAASQQGPQAQARRAAELDIARSEGVADALRPETGLIGPDEGEMERLRGDVAVLDAAVKLTSSWVTVPQKDRLDALSGRITDLARSFGMMNLTVVELDGAARMKVTTGGATTSYSTCERGEKLRLKVATAIALIEQARRSGVGRHPGLLFVDSPGSEEMDDDDFDTMLDALDAAAADADIQVVVATRHVDSLLGLLGLDRCRVGRGTNFVW